MSFILISHSLPFPSQLPLISSDVILLSPDTGAGALLRNHIEETALPIERQFITDISRIYQELRNC